MRATPTRSTLTACAVFALGLAPTLASGAIAFPDHPYAVQTDAAGFRIDGKYQLLRGGSLQYWRLPKAVWRDRIKRFKAAGFNTIDMYVPWNVVEPVEGQFNFTDPDLTGFLDLCKQLGVFVYLRPGPYITNEMDGGGMPAWMAARSTKKSLGADGKPNLRTYDPDYLASVQRYLSRLDQVVKPYLASRGGPIVLYSIENEYNWFEIFKEIDKAAWYEGGWERPVAEGSVTRRYLEALRDMVRADGIDVPLTTCPGDGKLSGIGDVAGVIPMPNMYAGLGGSAPEQAAKSVLDSMHDAGQHGGVYTQYPSGTTETDRLPPKLKRFFMGGLDAAFAFNLVGTHQEGYRNGIALNIDSVKAIIDTNDTRSLVQKISGMTVGYYHNVIDFNGAISASGGHRDNYYEFRRDNAMLDTLTPWIAPLTSPQRSSSTGSNSDQRLVIDNAQVGAPEGTDRWHYWWLSPQGTALIGLVNQTTTDQVIGVNGIHLMGERFPRYVPVTIPLESFDGKPQFGDADLTYAQVLPVNLPVPTIGRLHYLTSELMWSRAFNDEQLLVVHGKTGTQGEINIDAANGLRVMAADAGVTVREQTGDHLVATWTHGGVQQLIARDNAGHTLRIVILDQALAGRTWQIGTPGRQMLVVGADYIDEDSVKPVGNTLNATIDVAAPGQALQVIAPSGQTLSGNLVAVSANPATQLVRYRTGALAALPVLPGLWNNARQQGDLAEASVQANDSGWQHFQGNPQPLERRGINTGHAWYRSHFNWNGTPSDSVPVYVDHASDIVGIYVNGHYVSTVAPLGTEISSMMWSQRYRFASVAPYLKQGDNVIAFRTEIWGHGAFMFPRGKMMVVGPSAPALGFDSLKGLYGPANVGGVPLTQWTLRDGLGGEKSGYQASGFDDARWSAVNGPTLALDKGDVRWVRTRFDTADLPSPATLQAPVVLQLKGQRAKATIYLNGRLIGRWISDNKLFQQGFWASGMRDMWMNTDPDHFPLAREALNAPGQPNVLAIAFEDTSHSDAGAGSIDSMTLQYARENRRFDNTGTMQRIAATRWRLPVVAR